MKLNWPTRITILRIFLIIPFVSCMLKINDSRIGSAMRYASIVIYAFMLVTDMLDGYLARKNKQITRLGTFLDPVADKLLIACACLLLTSQRGHVHGFALPPTVAVFVIGRDVLLLVGFLTVYFITSRLYIFPALVGKIAGRTQLVMIAAILIAPELSSLLPGWIWLLRILWWSAAGASLMSAFAYIRSGSRYIEQCEQANT